jgi:hypothetical protein
MNFNYEKVLVPLGESRSELELEDRAHEEICFVSIQLLVSLLKGK